MPKGYSYIRFSHPQQMRGDSLRRQIQGSADYCKRKGLTLDETLKLRDLGVSAFRGKNAEAGAFRAFLDAVESGRVPEGSTLIVESLDRLSRNALGKAQALILSLLNSGITIVTLNPEREYTPASANDIGAAVEILCIFFRANEESATKSKRLKASWENKRRNAAAKPMTSRGPGWLRLDEQNKWQFVPDRVEVVRRIYDWAANGRGCTQIVKALNAEGVEPFANGKEWHRSSVQKILCNRATIGEMQPTRWLPDGSREPQGDPIKGYYPRIVSDSLFYRAQQQRERRRTYKVKGRQGDYVSNLFTGLLVNAKDGSTFVMRPKRWRRADGFLVTEPRMVSSGAQSGRAKAVRMSFDYSAFEAATLAWLLEMKPSAIVGADARSSSSDVDNLIEAETSKLLAVDDKISKVQAKMLGDGGDFDALVAVLSKLDAQKKEVKRKLVGLRSQQLADPETSVLANVWTMIKALNGERGNTLLFLRERLKASIASLIERVDVEVSGPSWNLTADVTARFRTGGTFRYLVNRRRMRPTVLTATPEMAARDNWTELPLPPARPCGNQNGVKGMGKPRRRRKAA